MNINQKVIKLDMNTIIKIIEQLYKKNFKNDFNFDIKIFFPKKKDFFDFYIEQISLIKNNNLSESLIYYKGYGYKIINKILINEKFPLILKYNEYKSKLKINKTKFNTRALYIFPDDIEYIKKYEQNKILNHIKNIDGLFKKDFCKLSDCILFRGMQEKIQSNNSKNIDDYSIFDKLTGFKNTKIFDNNKNEILFKNYSSFSFNPLVSLNFSESYDDSDIPYFIILNIKKEHNIPGFFLSGSLFESNNTQKYNENKYDEIEILISRNLKIKILKITKIKKNKKMNHPESIKNIYSKDSLIKKHTEKYFKIIYAESMPFEYPSELNIQDGYKYLCM